MAFVKEDAQAVAFIFFVEFVRPFGVGVHRGVVAYGVGQFLARLLERHGIDHDLS